MKFFKENKIKKIQGLSIVYLIGKSASGKSFLCRLLKDAYKNDIDYVSVLSKNMFYLLLKNRKKILIVEDLTPDMIKTIYSIVEQLNSKDYKKYKKIIIISSYKYEELKEVFK